uniref:Uncharacterized protein n=1 Tax=uncultured bacterium contig00036 TaxID=1181524 RepID=A0A806KEN4_9BACT|nr:hypothetical protein [uncultured bacterium contig00036]
MLADVTGQRISLLKKPVRAEFSASIPDPQITNIFIENVQKKTAMVISRVKCNQRHHPYGFTVGFVCSVFVRCLFRICSAFVPSLFRIPEKRSAAVLWRKIYG